VDFGAAGVIGGFNPKPHGCTTSTPHERQQVIVEALATRLAGPEDIKSMTEQAFAQSAYPVNVKGKSVVQKEKVPNPVSFPLDRYLIDHKL
jgi:hypothetical protein